MTVIWLNGTVGAGKTRVGRAIAGLVRAAIFVDGDDHAGPSGRPGPAAWRRATDALTGMVARRRRGGVLVVAYPLDGAGFRRLRAACARARRALIVVDLAPPLALTLRSRGGRVLSAAERRRVRAMRSEGYHRRPFASFRHRNAPGPAARTAREIVRRAAPAGRHAGG